MSDELINCRECRYWIQRSEIDGECRRHAPRARHDTKSPTLDSLQTFGPKCLPKFVATWPRTDIADCCGDGQLRKVAR